jgi:hypothetical protein
MVGVAKPLDALTGKDIALEQQVQGAVQQHAAAEDDAARANARKTVRDLLEQQFMLRQERRMREIVELENQAKRLRETMRKRANAKEQIIDRRLSDLLDADELGWEPGASAGIPGAAGLPAAFRQMIGAGQ